MGIIGIKWTKGVIIIEAEKETEKLLSTIILKIINEKIYKSGLINETQKNEILKKISN